MSRTKHLAARGIKTRGERVERILRKAANALLDLSDLGFESHYLKASYYRTDLCLSNARRNAVAVFRPPIAASFHRALPGSLECSRLFGFDDRREPLSAFLSACLRWVRTFTPECSCVIAYSDPGAVNDVTGLAHSGGIYRAANFVHVRDADRAEPHWLAEDGSRINRQRVVRLLGTGSRDRVAALRPGWQYVAGTRKRLFVYPMALTVPAVIDALSALPRSARTRPFRLSAGRR